MCLYRVFSVLCMGYMLVEINCKVMSNLFCALDLNELNRISKCDSAKEISDKHACNMDCSK